MALLRSKGNDRHKLVIQLRSDSFRQTLHHGPSKGRAPLHSALDGCAAAAGQGLQAQYQNCQKKKASRHTASEISSFYDKALPFTGFPLSVYAILYNAMTVAGDPLYSANTSPMAMLIPSDTV